VKLTIESTTKTVMLDGVPARIWEGHTESGIPVHCFVTRIAVDRADDTSQFEVELSECRPPRNRDVDAYPMRLVL
jgi:hypothetical protein